MRVGMEMGWGPNECHLHPCIGVHPVLWEG